MTPHEIREKAEKHALKAEEILSMWPKLDDHNASTRATAHALLSQSFIALLATDRGYPIPVENYSRDKDGKLVVNVDPSLVKWEH